MIKVANTALSNLSGRPLCHGNYVRVPEIWSALPVSREFDADRHLYFIMFHDYSEARAWINKADRITEKFVIICIIEKCLTLQFF